MLMIYRSGTTLTPTIIQAWEKINSDLKRLHQSTKRNDLNVNVDTKAIILEKNKIKISYDLKLELNSEQINFSDADMKEGLIMDKKLN